MYEFLKGVLVISGVFTGTWRGARRHNLRTLLVGRALPVKLGTASFQCRLRGCNLHPTRWQKRFLRAPPGYTLAPHVRLPRGLKTIASSSRTELNRDLTHFPDAAMIRITFEAAYCGLTVKR